MSTSPPRPPRRTAAFRPQFTLLLLYLFGFFFVICFAVVLPALIEAAMALPPGGELTPQEKADAARIAQDALRGRAPWAFLVAVLCVAAGTYTQVLPGLRRR